MTLLDNLRREVKVRRDHLDDYDEEITSWIEQAADRIEALEATLRLCEDVLGHVQKAYNCPDSPIINKAREQATAALAPEQDK